jgi:hypothetical protein
VSRWTEAELAALRTTSSYTEFANKTQSDKSFDAWEVKRRRVDANMPYAMSAAAIQRAMVNNVKVARQIIRLRHSIEADDELADVLPKIKETLALQAQSGHVEGLSYDELRLLIYG